MHCVDGYDASTFGDRWAEVYDRWGWPEAPVDDTVGFLAERAGGGRVLELAIGTGRVALPLRERGLEVHGIDASEAMLARLRANPGGDAVPVELGDMADVAVEGTFSLVYLVFNTFFGLLTQEEQVRCFANVAARLEEGGAFVLEAFVPDVTRFDRDQRVDAYELELDRARFDLSRHDPVAQQVWTQHVVLDDDGFRLLPIALRYAYPSELDLMGRLAGLELRERHGGWHGEPFTARSGQHVSVYGKPD